MPKKKHDHVLHMRLTADDNEALEDAQKLLDITNQSEAARRSFKAFRRMLQARARGARLMIVEPTGEQSELWPL